jgi:VCBS repeat-containing protein
MYIEHQKGTAFELIFPMRDSTTPANFKTGLSPTDTAYYKDGAGSWTSLSIADTAAEIGSTGVYEISLTTSELNHDWVMVAFTASGAAATCYLFRMDGDIPANVESVETDAINAAALKADAVNEIRDAILADSTAFNGASIAAILADTNELQTDDVPGLIAALNDLSAAAVNAEVDAALDTAIPGSPTAGSINERLKALDDAYTAVRASYLDNLNVGGLVASSAEVTAIQNNTRVRVIVPFIMERPDSGSTSFKLHLYVYDTDGNMEALDSTPTITAENQAGTNRSGNLGTVTLESTGHYSVTYSVTDSHAIEQLIFEWTVVEGGVTRLHGAASQIVDTTAVDFTASDWADLQAILVDTAEIGAAGAGLTDVGLSAAALQDIVTIAQIQAECEAALAAYTAATAANISSAESSIRGADSDDLKSISDEIGALNDIDGTAVKLAADGLNAVVVETGLNMLEVMRLIAAALCGTLAGANTTEVTIKNAGGTTTRIVATVDQSGNRSAVVLTP